MKLVNIEIIKDELERLIRNYRFYSSTEAKYRYEAYKELSEWLDGLEVKETGAVWHSFDEVLPPQSSDICVYWNRDKIITTGIWEESEKPKYASKWAYTDDLLQEPTNPFDSHIQEGDNITVNENGSRFNRSQLERVIDENPLNKEIQYLHQRYPEISFAKLSRIVVHVAKWKEEQMQKEAIQMIQDAVERTVKEDAGGYPYIEATELYDYDNDKPLAKAGDKIKVVFIKDK